MKTVFITGANQGIGLETARQLEALGYFVFIGCRDAVKGRIALDNLKRSGALNVAFVEIDVTNTNSIKQARQQLEKQIVVLDILINNAAIAGPQMQQIDLTDIGQLRAVFETNFFGVVQTTRQLIPLLSKANLPVIVNVSSELGSLNAHLERSNPNYLHYDAYSASKAALNAFTVLLAGQLKNALFKINSVTPGYTATHLNGYQGAKTPSEAARIIVHYATIDSDGPTGGFFGQNGAIPW